MKHSWITVHYQFIFTLWKYSGSLGLTHLAVWCLKKEVIYYTFSLKLNKVTDSCYRWVFQLGGTVCFDCLNVCNTCRVVQRWVVILLHSGKVINHYVADLQQIQLCWLLAFTRFVMNWAIVSIALLHVYYTLENLVVSLMQDSV